MKNISSFQGVSLIELLAALCILVIVITITAPIFSEIQSQAQDTTALQIQIEMNNTYANWKTSGGSISGTTPYGSIILYVLSSASTQQTVSSPDGLCTVADRSSSSAIRMSLPPGTPALDPTVAGGMAPTNTIETTDFTVFYDPSTDTFKVFSNSELSKLTFSAEGTSLTVISTSPGSSYSAAGDIGWPTSGQSTPMTVTDASLYPVTVSQPNTSGYLLNYINETVYRTQYSFGGPPKYTGNFIWSKYSQN